jgi:hypothetical protein
MRIFVPGRICLFGEHSDWAGVNLFTGSRSENKAACGLAATGGF